MIHIKSEREIKLMEDAATALKAALKVIEENIRVGVTTLELNDLAEREMLKHGSTPAFKGVPCPYKGGKSFKWAICTSVNDEIIHGIPSDKVVLKDGDIVSVDMGTLKNGWYSDAGRTYIVGTPTKNAKKLVDVAKNAFFAGIEQAKPGNRVGDISNAIQEYVEKQGFTLLQEYQGHGIGEQMHEDPGVPNIGRKNTGARLQKGMALAIEPMICEGRPDVYVKKDMWTIATLDKKMTAYYENTIIIEDDGVKILTLD